ncbi:hypothetical protein [Microcoleus sp. CAWBG58]|uniref:hypothetical protein n=1 Tax=Microcoleus sp. CAWBG58 TaxID=2841651 RepID=UPI0025F0A5D4|nr:hypothetical protein [Microcoleus sp. CAWBG58]
MSQNRLSVGVTSLNKVIGGCLIPECSYLVRGGPLPEIDELLHAGGWNGRL